MLEQATRSGTVLNGIPFRDLWVLEWSHSQQAFHVDTLMDSLRSNIEGFCRGGKTGDYVALGIFETRESCDRFYESCLERMKRWDLSDMTVDDLLKALGPP